MRSICERRLQTSEEQESFTEDSLMCGEEAALSLRRLSGERLLFTLSRVQLFRRRKVVGIDLQVAVGYLFTPKINNSQPSASVSTRCQLFLKLDAVNPVFWRKVLQKCSTSLKPQAAATSDTERLCFVMRSSFARLILTSMR